MAPQSELRTGLRQPKDEILNSPALSRRKNVSDINERTSFSMVKDQRNLSMDVKKSLNEIKETNVVTGAFVRPK